MASDDARQTPTSESGRRRRWRPHRTGIVLTAILLLYWSGYLMLRPLVGPIAVDLGASSAVTALIVAAAPALSFVIALPVGRISDRLDARTVMLSGAGFMVLTGLLLLAPLNLWVLFASQLLFGVGTLIVWLGAQEQMTQGPRRNGTVATLDPRRRHQQIANYTFVISAGQFLGPAMGGAIADAFGFTTVFVVFVAAGALLVVAGLSYPKVAPPPVAAEGKPPIRRAYADAWRIAGSSRGIRATLVTAFFALYLTDLRVAVLPLVLQAQNVSLTRIGLYLAVAAALGMVSRPLLPVLLVRIGPPASAAVSLIPSALALAATPLVADGPLMFTLIIVHGTFIGLTQPLTLSLLTIVTDQSQRGLAFAGRMMAHRMAQWLGPLVVAGLASMVALTPAFVIAAAAAVPFGGAVTRSLASDEHIQRERTAAG